MFRNSPPLGGGNEIKAGEGIQGEGKGERGRGEGKVKRGREGKGKRGREGKLPKIGHWLSKNWGRKSSAKKGRGE